MGTATGTTVGGIKSTELDESTNFDRSVTSTELTKASAHFAYGTEVGLTAITGPAPDGTPKVGHDRYKQGFSRDRVATVISGPDGPTYRPGSNGTYVATTKGTIELSDPRNLNATSDVAYAYSGAVGAPVPTDVP